MTSKKTLNTAFHVEINGFGPGTKPANPLSSVRIGFPEIAYIKLTKMENMLSHWLLLFFSIRSPSFHRQVFESVFDLANPEMQHLVWSKRYGISGDPFVIALATVNTTEPQTTGMELHTLFGEGIYHNVSTKKASKMLKCIYAKGNCEELGKIYESLGGNVCNKPNNVFKH